MYKVAVTDITHDLRIYEYDNLTLEEAEGLYNGERFNALLIKEDTETGTETIVKSK